MIYGIALGSNLGDRERFLQQGLEELLAHEAIQLLAVAPLFESDPVDCPEGSQPFFNSVAEIETDLEPLELLDLVQSIQERAGREKVHGYNTPRTLDLDLLYAELLTYQDARLELPHPRMAIRRFVLEPLLAIAPDRSIPMPDGSSSTVSQLWIKLLSDEQPLKLVKVSWFSPA